MNIATSPFTHALKDAAGLWNRLWSWHQRQLDAKANPVEPAVDRQIIVRQRRPRTPLPPGHRERRERAFIPQRWFFWPAFYSVFILARLGIVRDSYRAASWIVAHGMIWEVS